MADRFGCSPDNYISDEYSICREERQYALYLHNILLKYKTPGARKDIRVKDIFSACKLDDAIVENVFYEATFMRDFFMRNRQTALMNKISNARSPEEELLNSPDKDRYRKKGGERIKQLMIPAEDSFNARLLEYEVSRLYEKPLENTAEIVKLIKELETIEDGKEMIEEINYGHNKADPSFKSELPGTTQKDFWDNIQRMMNAKPDIAVVYKKTGKKYLLFIECKFESSVSTYTGRSGKKGSDIVNYDITEDSGVETADMKKTDTQETLQYRIADFLIRYGYLNGIEIADCMKETGERAGGSLVVRFTRTGYTASDDPVRGFIPIKDLIDCNKDIFE